MKFVIFHGSLGFAEGNWFPNLKEKLEHMGQTVFCPQYPIDNEDTLVNDVNVPTIQNLVSWTLTFEKEVLPHLYGKEKVCFIGHSLGNVFILHLIEKYKIKLDCAIFVSPCLDRLPMASWKYDKVNSSFYKTDFDYEELIKNVPISYVLYSDTDPYIEPHRALHFAKVMQSSHIMVKRAGHLNSEVNMNEFPLVFDLCVTRLDLTLFQQYVYNRRVEDTVQNLRHAESKYILMKPEQLNDEGTFHFMHLSKGGFATFMSNAEKWNPNDEYFEGGRKLATSGLEISRVFVIVNPKNLSRPVLRKQIELDIKGKIQVYTISYADFKTIGCEEDFGIWDNEYICVQHRDENGKVTDGVIDARVKSLLTAQNWRDRITRLSKRIKSMKDLN